MLSQEVSLPRWYFDAEIGLVTTVADYKDILTVEQIPVWELNTRCFQPCNCRKQTRMWLMFLSFQYF